MPESYPIELTAPDISAYQQGNTGVDYVHTFASGKTGPHVMINALMHGNEICGAIALDLFLREDLRPSRGTLTLCFVNVAAFARFDPLNPNISRFVDEDMNRVWLEERLDGDENTVELQRARLLRPLYEQADYLLDIHSMSTLSEPILLCHGLLKERELAQNMTFPRTVACGSGHVVGQRLIEYTPFNDANNHKTALLIECGQHWQKEAAPVAIDTALYYLKALNVLPTDFFDTHISCRQPKSQWMLNITGGYTAKTDAFRFAEEYRGLEVFEQQGTVIAFDNKEKIQTPHDNCVLVMPNHRAQKNMRALRFARQST